MEERKREVRLRKQSNKNIESDFLMGFIIALLAFSTLGMVIYEVGSNIERLEDEEEYNGELLGRLMIEIGLMVSSILLISFGLGMKKSDSTIRFGCLLIGGIIVAFTLITFF